MQLRGALRRMAGPRGLVLIRHIRTRRFIRAYKNLLRGMNALEIGGPSDIFGSSGPLPIYACLGSIDNCNYSDRTLWHGEAVSYNRTLIAEGTALPAEDSKYDCVIACHCLEHIANPIKALLEWKRVLRKGGLLLLVLPNPNHTFDWRRPVTKLEHLREDFDRDTPESDLTHLDEVLALHDLSRDPEAGTPEQFKARCLRNSEFRAIHHHVFLPESAAAFMRENGFSVVRQDLPDIHIITLGRKL
jgi:SAM-dependent methyltransferase